MFSTLKAKILFLVILTMATAAGGVMYFTHGDVGIALRDREREYSRSILQLLGHTLPGENDGVWPQKEMNQIIHELESSFRNLKIAHSGSAFLFNGNGEVLIAPPNALITDYPTLRNQKTGNLLLFDLKKAAHEDAESILYATPTLNHGFPMEAAVRYVKMFDWYLVVAFPLQEIQYAARIVVTRQSAVLITIFCISLIAAYYLVARISRPLKRLAVYAKEIPLQDFTNDTADIIALADLPIESNDEVGHLTESFITMKAELRKNIQDIMEVQTKYRVILESIEEGFFETDLKGRLTFYSPCFCTILGCGEEMQPETFYRHHMTADTFKKVRQEFHRVYRSGIPVDIQGCKILGKDGEQKDCELSVYLAKDQTGNPTGFRGVVRDVSGRLKAETEKKQLEAQLLRAQKMEALGTLAGGIAHDFNNVLTAVIGYTELAMQAHASNDGSNDNLNKVLKAAFRARDLVNQILTFSHQTEQTLKPIMIGPIVKETLTFLKATIPSGIEIRTHIHTESDIVLSDPTKIHQTVMNLCTNAAHAMWDNGGVLEVSLTNREIITPNQTCDPDLIPGSYLKLRVKDTGHGMDPDTLDRIFDPYFTTKEKENGTGLGLSVTLGIVKSQGGSITVFSQPNKGTTFDVYLPLARKTEVKENIPVHSPAKQSKRPDAVDREEPALGTIHTL